MTHAEQQNEHLAPPMSLSRRTVVGTGAAAAIAGAVAGPLAGPAPARSHGSGRPSTDGRDLVLKNGRIHTTNGRHDIVRVLAIRDGRVVYAGDTLSAALRAVPDRTRVLDLRGRTAIPGIIDNHNHLVLMGNRPGRHTPLENAYSVADVQRTYRARARGVPSGEFITTIGGFHFNQFTEVRLPTLAELDAAVPDHPAYISVGFSGPSVTNSRGRAFFETAAQPVAVGADGSIAGGQETGRATLALRRTLTFEQRRRGALDAMAYALGLGVTTHLDQGAFQATGTPSDGAAHEDNYTMHLPFLSLYAQGKATVRLRINFLHMDTDPALPTLTDRLNNQFPFFGDDMVRTGGIGEFVAAGIGATWLEAAKKVARAGWRAEVHSLSQTDFRTEIEGFEAVDAETPITGLRWVVAHVPFITRDYVDRLKALGGGLSLTGWRYLTGTATAAGPPFRMIVDSGIPAGMSSDGMQIAPMNPFIHAYYATTGRNALGAVINDGQQISRRELLDLYTRDNAWFLGGPDDDQLGTLEVGRLGDVAVLDRDYFTVPDDQLRQVSSVLTVVGGAIAHSTGRVDL
ncbi:amidohydrolase [Virgisporangium ochraceum]|uniref:Amidohydrolase n=1 Tax=Virgisporangium ochraceum TaxID=65505 RepID=A0A8J4A269_9ACTN|nr:amidohydrolase family protein [Virgisporangium ochraceum]GIJ73237.1 amidohydrolase [Virgisporangium ochraceum]